MWKQLGLAVLAAALAPAASASPWYAEAGYGGTDVGTFALGYEVRPWLGIEAGYRRADHGFDFPLVGGKRRVNDIRGFDVSLRGVLQVSPRFALTGRFGLYDWQSTRLRFGPEWQPAFEETSSLTPVVGAGLRAGLTDRLDFTAEYTASAAYSEARDGLLTVGLRAGF
jgi:opacity protein-like surface antigen